MPLHGQTSRRFSAFAWMVFVTTLVAVVYIQAAGERPNDKNTFNSYYVPLEYGWPFAYMVRDAVLLSDEADSSMTRWVGIDRGVCWFSAWRFACDMVLGIVLAGTSLLGFDTLRRKLSVPIRIGLSEFLGIALWITVSTGVLARAEVSRHSADVWAHPVSAISSRLVLDPDILIDNIVWLWLYMAAGLSICWITERGKDGVPCPFGKTI